MEHNRSFLISAVLMAILGMALLVFTVFANLNPSIIIRWETATELNTAGYAVYRADSAEGPFEKITTDLIPASTDPLTGGSYEYDDTDVQVGRTYYYQLHEIETTGVTSVEGPIEATAALRGVAEGVLGLILLAFAAFTLKIALRRPEKPSA